MKIHSTASNTSHAILLVRTRFCTLNRARLARDSARTIARESIRDGAGHYTNGSGRRDSRANACTFNSPSIGDNIRDSALDITSTTTVGDVSAHVGPNARAGASECHHYGPRNVIFFRVRENAYRFVGDCIRAVVVDRERDCHCGTPGEPTVVPRIRRVSNQLRPRRHDRVVMVQSQRLSDP